jgi:hypothetical protein
MEPELSVVLGDGSIKTYLVLWFMHSDMLKAMHSFDPTAMNSGVRLPDHVVEAAIVFDKVCLNVHSQHFANTFVNSGADANNLHLRQACMSNASSLATICKQCSLWMKCT